MFAGSRWRMLPLLVLLALGLLVACQKSKREQALEAESAAEIKRKADVARKSLDGLKAPLSALDAKFAALRQQFDKLPPDLPEFGETRGKFYAASVSQGAMTAKVPWLSGRIDAALKSRNGAELAAISKDIAHTYEEIREADRVSLELLHEVQPFKQRMEELRQRAEELRARGKVSCE